MNPGGYAWPELALEKLLVASISARRAAIFNQYAVLYQPTYGGLCLPGLVANFARKVNVSNLWMDLLARNPTILIWGILPPLLLSSIGRRWRLGGSLSSQRTASWQARSSSVIDHRMFNSASGHPRAIPVRRFSRILRPSAVPDSIGDGQQTKPSLQANDEFYMAGSSQPQTEEM